MKILLLGHPEIASRIALERLVSALGDHHLTVRLSPPSAPSPATPEPLHRLAEMDSALCAANDAPADGMAGFSALGPRTGQPVAFLADPNSAQGLAHLANLAPDLVVSVRYRKILRDAAIAVPARGVINLHSGLLPQYRGVMATFRAMLARESTIGSTLHYIDDGGIDTGRTIGRAKVPLDPARSYLANVLELYPSGCDLVVNAVRTIQHTGSVPARIQPGDGGYFTWPTADELDAFAAMGYRLGDGNELADYRSRHGQKR